jgi:hypothetical protein
MIIFNSEKKIFVKNRKKINLGILLDLHRAKCVFLAPVSVFPLSVFHWVLSFSPGGGCMPGRGLHVLHSILLIPHGT